jgi:heme-binding protein
MKRLWRVLRWMLVIVAGLFLIAQVVRPAKTNPPINQSASLEAYLNVDPPVAAILDRSCADCHSNKTRWPWYSHVAPVSWFVIDHVNEGRSNLNFSEWGKLSWRQQRGMLEQICRETRSGMMPLSSYTPMHPGSKLSPEDVKTLCTWADAQRAQMDAR